MIKTINNIVKFIFFAFLSILVVGLSSKLIGMIIDNELIAFAGGLLLVFMIFAFFVLFHAKIESTIKKIVKCFDSYSATKLAIILGVLCLVTKLTFVFIFKCDSNLHSDMRKYISFAEQIANNGIITEDASYAATFSYTVFYGFLLSPLGKLFSTNSLGYSVFLTIITSFVMVLLFDIIKKFSSKTIAFCGIMIYNLLPPGLFQTQVVIHETALLFFHILSLWFFIKALDNKTKPALRISFGILSYFLIVFGATVNAAGRIILISYAIITVTNILSNKSTRSVIFCKIIPSLLAIILVFCGLKLCSAITNSCKKHFVDNPSQANTEYRLAKGWALYLGFNYNTSGGWNEEDRETYDKYHEFNTKEEAINYQKNLIKERLSEYIENPLRFPIHFYKKIIFLWSPYFPYSSVPTSPGYQGLILGYGGLFQKALFVISYIGYIVTFLIALLGIYSKKHNSYKPSVKLHFMMTPLGFTAALMLFEVMPKYSSHLAIILFAVAIMNYSAFKENLSLIKCKFFKQASASNIK